MKKIFSVIIFILLIYSCSSTYYYRRYLSVSKTTTDSVNKCDKSGLINGRWLIEGGSLNDYYHGAKTIDVFYSYHGYLDSTYKLYDEKNLKLLEEIKFHSNKYPIICKTTKIDSVKLDIYNAANDFFSVKRYREDNGLLMEEDDYSPNNHKTISYYTDTLSILAIHYFLPNKDSIAYYYRNGIFKGYDINKGSITIEYRILYNSLINK